MINEPVTAWEFECTCGFEFEIPMTADDPTGEYALEIAMTHILECDGDATSDIG